MKQIDQLKKENPLILAVVFLVIVIGLSYGLRERPKEMSGVTTYDVEIHYTDGSTRIISGDKGLLSIFRGTTPLTVVDDTGRPIEEISYTVKVKVTYTGIFYNGKITGTITTQVNDATKDTYAYTKTYAPGTKMPNGNNIIVVTGSVTKYGLQDWGRSGSNSLKVVNQAKVDIWFDDNTQDSKTGQGGFVITYEIIADGGITSVDTTVSPGFLY